MANKNQFAKCHPDRLHAARGLCAPCYAREHHAANRETRLAKMRAYNHEVRHDRRRRRPAPCHLDRAHFAHGLCAKCYAQSDHAKALRRARNGSKPALAAAPLRPVWGGPTPLQPGKHVAQVTAVDVKRGTITLAPVAPKPSGFFSRGGK